MTMPPDDKKIEELLKAWKPAEQKATSHFVDAVMRRVYDLPTPRPWWKALFDVRQLSIQLRPAVAVAVIFVLGIGIGYWISRPAPVITISTEELHKPQSQKEFVVKFVYVDPNAKSVHVLGDFNGWQQTPLKRQAGGMWTLTLPMAEGQYNYQFLVDGQKFVTDPSAPEETDDGFGQTDSVLRL